MKHFFIKICLLLFFFVFSNLLAYEYELSVVAIFQNEARFMKEWIDFHKNVGVEHFYLYNNNSKDKYEEVLKPYIQSGQVELLQWNFKHTDIAGWSAIQNNAYKDAVDRSCYVSKWLIIIDTDEFIFPVQKNTLIDFLEDFNAYASVCANWQMYGTSHVTNLLPGESMLEKLTHKANWCFHAHRHVKSIVRPEFVENIINPHFVILKDGHRQVTENFLPFDGAETPYTSIYKIRINHYWTRDEHFLMNNKIPRRKFWPGDSDYILKEAAQMNEVYDDIILKLHSK